MAPAKNSTSRFVRQTYTGPWLQRRDEGRSVGLRLDSASQPCASSAYTQSTDVSIHLYYLVNFLILCTIGLTDAHRRTATRIRISIMQWQTHEVSNQVPELQDYNLFDTDIALREGVQRERAGWHSADLSRFGAELGSNAVLELGQLANRHEPEFLSHDRFGNRIDRVDFHPSWHELLRLLRREGLHALPWMEPRPGAQVARAAGYFLQSQVESGSLCPTTMTFAAIPVLQNEPVLFASLKAQLFSREHDPRDLPLAQKKSILIGMGMTEKQGGSDVRSNTTLARPIHGSGRGAEYALTGHKWFFSAPMCDAHMVLARADGGTSCFFVPRWRPERSQHAVLVQRLKDQPGNRSNA